MFLTRCSLCSWPVDSSRSSVLATNRHDSPPFGRRIKQEDTPKSAPLHEAPIYISSDSEDDDDVPIKGLSS